MNASRLHEMKFIPLFVVSQWCDSKINGFSLRRLSAEHMAKEFWSGAERWRNGWSKRMKPLDKPEIKLLQCWPQWMPHNMWRVIDELNLFWLAALFSMSSNRANESQCKLSCPKPIEYISNETNDDHWLHKDSVGMMDALHQQQTMKDFCCIKN